MQSCWPQWWCFLWFLLCECGWKHTHTHKEKLNNDEGGWFRVRWRRLRATSLDPSPTPGMSQWNSQGYITAIGKDASHALRTDTYSKCFLIGACHPCSRELRIALRNGWSPVYLRHDHIGTTLPVPQRHYMHGEFIGSYFAQFTTSFSCNPLRVKKWRMESVSLSVTYGRQLQKLWKMFS